MVWDRLAHILQGGLDEIDNQISQETLGYHENDQELQYFQIKFDRGMDLRDFPGSY